MKYTKKFLHSAVALLALVANSTYAAEFKANEVIVKYKADDSGMVIRTRSMMNSLYQAAGIQQVRRYSGMMKGFEQLILDESIRVEDAIAILQSSPVVEYAQPNYILSINPVRAEAPAPDQNGIPCIPGFEIPNCDPKACIIPGLPFPPGCEDGGGGNPGEPNPPNNPPATRPELAPRPDDVNPPVADPSIEKLYGLNKIDAAGAWDVHQGSQAIIVADIDTGVDYNHEDLSFNMWRNPNPSAKNDVVGYDFVHNDGLPFDDNQHGTHTSGTIGAVGGNGKGIVGVTQRVSIMALKFLSSEGSGTTADAIRAIDYAVEHGAKILSNSWGGKGDDGNKALFDAIERAKEKDVLFIAAAGNDGTDNDGGDPSFPAAFDNDNLISVAATDKNDGMAFFSNYGKKSTHLAAPGVNIYSTVPSNKYASFSGTSMACPHVAGAAALVWAKNPTWNYKQVKESLLKSVDQLQVLQGKTVTGGRLNVAKALRSTD